MKKTGCECIPIRFIGCLRDILVEDVNLRPSYANQSMIYRLGYTANEFPADIPLDGTVRNKLYTFKRHPQL